MLGPLTAATPDLLQAPQTSIITKDTKDHKGTKEATPTVSNRDTAHLHKVTILSPKACTINRNRAIRLRSLGTLAELRHVKAPQLMLAVVVLVSWLLLLAAAAWISCSEPLAAWQWRRVVHVFLRALFCINLNGQCGRETE
ncbi:hypothetical protein N7468_002322 [Penicillium chermesinum]|uniref:Uncharacterized protein n=1 Tax=Penicillium chermesinum TaxID=63820 RepID=A0A9W9PI94_9EURO|nr:uncharacterized protein N7468_002322 [Penicillium chermesinum]KAJ5247339.1 hypothetical protein N7468_002322 [Penicillium chermesinum]